MIKTGVIAALPVEAACLQRHISQRQTPIALHDTLSLVICGIGKDNAIRGAEMLVDCGIKRLISWGFASALSEALRTGDIILPMQVATRDKHWSTSATWREQYHKQLTALPGQIHTGTLADSQTLLTTSSEKKALRQDINADAADMESATIGAIATKNELDFIIIRAISDDLNTALPPCVSQYSDPFGNIIWPGFLLSLCRNPAQIIMLWRLWRGLRAAQQGLRHAGRMLLHPQ